MSREDPGKNGSSASPCKLEEAIKWGGPSDEAGKKLRACVTAGVARQRSLPDQTRIDLNVNSFT